MHLVLAQSQCRATGLHPSRVKIMFDVSDRLDSDVKVLSRRTLAHALLSLCLELDASNLCSAPPPAILTHGCYCLPYEWAIGWCLRHSFDYSSSLWNSHSELTPNTAQKTRSAMELSSRVTWKSLEDKLLLHRHVFFLCVCSNKQKRWGPWQHTGVNQIQYS